MKDAKGHGSDPRGAHAAGIDQVGRSSLQLPSWFHGSPSGEPGNGPVHVGTAEAARAALEARIGTPADGRGWDGSREYGKTLLAGQDTQARLEASGVRPKFSMRTGHNSQAPKQDYLPGDRSERATFGDNSPVPDSARPAIHSYNIVGAMSNNPGRAYDDARANGMAKRLVKSGVYYKNIGEDAGSVSAVVPSRQHLRRVP